VRNFDQFVGVDWSGSKAINTKSIALSICEQGMDAPKLLSDMRSRSAVVDYILKLANDDKRTLIGIDANFGYYHQIGKRHFGQDYTAFDQWRIIDKHSQTDPNFYAGGFFNHADYCDDFWQEGTKPDWFDAESLRRETEIQCIKDGYGHPESPFKICYTKQVGKGGMAAMRVARHLRQELGDKIAIWPFEETDKAKIVMTEIYPRQFLMRSGYGMQKVKSAEDLNGVLPFFNSQSLNTADNVTDHDTDALVSSAGLRYLCGMNKELASNLTSPQGMTEISRRCEGWIFGVGDKQAGKKS